ncbi:MAG: IS200/IS605 family element transposase accessory protein TnpB [Candidatus Riflebacteria bacterium]|nr:IS200/IS605 family element transposase accessory protein TnpB [Candidatus Riflebacteria bacterium]
MYHNTKYFQKRNNNKLSKFFDYETEGAKNLKNTANFYIRNTMTGIKKDKPTQNEQEVLDTVFSNIEPINKKLRENYDKKIAKIKKDKNLSEEEKQRKIKRTHLKQFKAPTKEKWFLSYEFLDALFRHINLPEYRAIESHIAQKAIREVTDSWISYFESLKEYNKNPERYTGKPKIPGYIKKDRSTAIVTNQLAYISNGVLHLPNKNKFNISGHVPKGKFIEARIKPYYNGYQINIITDDEKSPVMSKDKGYLLLDPGLENFLTITDNLGGNPIIIKGGVFKSVNQYFNKTKADLVSILTKGQENSSYTPTKRLNNLSMYRDRFFDDAFYKVSHRIARIAVQRTCGKIIIGKNDFQKQKINLGHLTNQNFVCIPMSRFLQILKTVALKYGIEVIEQEESYTSKASFLDRDKIPTYKKGHHHNNFSGKRIHRGLYRSKDGTLLNADVNGSLNIGRKHNGHMFRKMKSYENLNNIEVITYKELYK